MPRIPLIAGVVMIAAAGLSACDQRAVAANGALQLAGSKYCAPFKPAGAAGSATLNAALTDPAGTFDDCVHRWGYTLAPARDPADVVAQATVNACSPILASWSQQLAGQGGDQGYQASSRDNRQQQPDPAAQRIRQAESKALFYVVQARASGCAPPPADTLFGATSTG